MKKSQIGLDNEGDTFVRFVPTDETEWKIVRELHEKQKQEVIDEMTKEACIEKPKP